MADKGELIYENYLKKEVKGRRTDYYMNIVFILIACAGLLLFILGHFHVLQTSIIMSMGLLIIGIVLFIVNTVLFARTVDVTYSVYESGLDVPPIEGGLKNINKQLLEFSRIREFIENTDDCNRELILTLWKKYFEEEVGVEITEDDIRSANESFGDYVHFITTDNKLISLEKKSINDLDRFIKEIASRVEKRSA